MVAINTEFIDVSMVNAAPESLTNQLLYYLGPNLQCALHIKRVYPGSRHIWNTPSVVKTNQLADFSGLDKGSHTHFNEEWPDRPTWWHLKNAPSFWYLLCYFGDLGGFLILFISRLLKMTEISWLILYYVDLLHCILVPIVTFFCSIKYK